MKNDQSTGAGSELPIDDRQASLRFSFTGSKSCINLYPYMNNFLYSVLDFFQKSSMIKSSINMRIGTGF